MGEMLYIDRSESFDPSFVCRGCNIWRGEQYGRGIQGAEEQDSRSLHIYRLDTSKIGLMSVLKGGEHRINGEERLRRLREEKPDFVRLDAKIWQSLWQNKHLIPESWKKRVSGKVIKISFDGTTLRALGGCRSTLIVCYGDGEWVRSYESLNNMQNSDILSAVVDSDYYEFLLQIN